MKKTLAISPDLKLPLDAVTWTFAILARKRAGKSYLAAVIAEEMQKAALPFVAFDPTGAWWGLRAAADGKGPGLPVVIIGGNHGDVPLEPTAGKVIADLVVDQPGYYILDFSLTESDAEQLRFGADFFSRLYRRKGLEKHRDPVMLFVDEADVWAPQQPQGPAENMALHHLRTLVRRGGIRGVGVTLITQRSAELSKGVLTQAEVLIALQTTGPQDIDAVETWIKRHGTKEQREAVLGSLPTLPKGDAWIWHPTGEIPLRRMRARPRTTFNSSATPEVGDRRVEPVQLARVDLDALRTQIGATIERAKAEDPRLLRERIGQLERELAKKATPAAVAPAPPKVQRVEVPIIKDAQIKALERLATTVGSLIAGAEKINMQAVEQAAIMQSAARTLGATLQEFRGAIASATAAPKLPAPPAPRLPPPRPSALVRVESSYGVDVGQSDAIRTAPAGDVEQRILNALAELEQLGASTPERELVGFLTGYSNTTSKGFRRGLAALQETQLVRFPTDGLVELTAEGRARAVPPPRPQTQTELHDRIIYLLGGATAKLLQGILAVHPDPADRAEVARAAGYGNLTSKGCREAFSRLKTLGFIDYPTPGQVRAMPVLFLGG